MVAERDNPTPESRTQYRRRCIGPYVVRFFVRYKITRFAYLVSALLKTPTGAGLFLALSAGCSYWLGFDEKESHPDCCWPRRSCDFWRCCCWIERGLAGRFRKPGPEPCIWNFFPGFHFTPLLIRLASERAKTTNMQFGLRGPSFPSKIAWARSKKIPRTGVLWFVNAADIPDACLVASGTDSLLHFGLK